jgi:hypothetical protein
MHRPRVDRQEEYLIAVIRSPGGENHWCFELSYVLPMTVALIYGMIDPNPFPCFMALFFLLFFRGWQLRADLWYGPIFRRVLEKYEAAFEEAEPAPGPSSGAP